MNSVLTRCPKLPINFGAVLFKQSSYSLAVAAISAVLPFTPLETYFGFVPPPAQFYFILAGMVVIYLLIVEAAKQGFYRWHSSGRPDFNVR